MPRRIFFLGVFGWCPEFTKESPMTINTGARGREGAIEELPSVEEDPPIGKKECLLVDPKEFCVQRCLQNYVPTMNNKEKDEPHAFLQLCELELRKCVSLIEHLPNNLLALKKLVIIGCNKLVSSLPICLVV
ncbi:hypothetical protein VNO77_02837 [Canavalia gladiata]|uniref:Uncharacterized protein n=1 Tax=Canavalia gladiata TaxID=3824 RepID=A0AAN9MUC5_CANGL